ncbi:uncharacterized protein EI90DRAFT_3030534 [Cantharellus anzutake]|uniref:uncharacterized protein n=1 Tax=Cantharellus anzutake TaxID=1750568 RepID=UPI001907AFD2|nr:uncharacterized protein EI90DRAFT_3030534 [Cantharellus anzutake]KAF8342876.1 hypothetical protein EI90DRAFT_3030534 [Cantharellus anzutake]
MTNPSSPRVRDQGSVNRSEDTPMDLHIPVPSQTRIGERTTERRSLPLGHKYSSPSTGPHSYFIHSPFSHRWTMDTPDCRQTHLRPTLTNPAASNADNVQVISAAPNAPPLIPAKFGGMETSEREFSSRDAHGIIHPIPSPHFSSLTIPQPAWALSTPGHPNQSWDISSISVTGAYPHRSTPGIDTRVGVSINLPFNVDFRISCRQIAATSAVAVSSGPPCSPQHTPISPLEYTSSHFGSCRSVPNDHTTHMVALEYRRHVTSYTDNFQGLIVDSPVLMSAPVGINERTVTEGFGAAGPPGHHLYYPQAIAPPRGWALETPNSSGGSRDDHPSTARAQLSGLPNISAVAEPQTTSPSMDSFPRPSIGSSTHIHSYPGIDVSKQDSQLHGGHNGGHQHHGLSANYSTPASHHEGTDRLVYNQTLSDVHPRPGQAVVANDQGTLLVVHPDEVEGLILRGLVRECFRFTRPSRPPTMEEIAETIHRLRQVPQRVFSD